MYINNFIKLPLEFVIFLLIYIFHLHVVCSNDIMQMLEQISCKGGDYMLEGFQPFEILSGSAFMSISNTGINFNKNVLIKMNKCHHIKLLINHQTKTVAIQQAQDCDEFAIPFVKDDIAIEKGVRIHNKELENTLSNLIDLDLELFTYRVDGEFLPADRAMLFNLTKGRRLKKRNKNL